MRFLRLALLFVAATGMRADDGLQLKSRRLAMAGQHLEGAPLKRLASGRSHVIVQFRSRPDPSRLAEFESAGVTPLRYVPNQAFLASVPDGARLEAPDVARIVRLEPEDKLSLLLPGQRGSGAFLIEFHPDVDAGKARALVRDHLLAIREHPALLPDQVMAEGMTENARRLAEWDEVAYIFPASRELVEGRPVRACLGGVFPEGAVGQYVAQVGPGWDPSGAKPVELGVRFSSAGAPPLGEAGKAEVLRALGEWSRSVKVGFVPGGETAAPRTIDVLFAAREHGDGSPFDGRGRVLAHTYYPAPPNPEPIAGDMHFDGDENWGNGGDDSIDLFSVALHEAGHALGLGHSDNPRAVMYPYYRRTTGLDQEDIDAIQQMYARRPVEPEPGEPDVPENPYPDLKLQIDTPADPSVSTVESAIEMAGTAQGGRGDIHILWSSSRGFSGSGAGARDWRIPGVPLEPGVNVVTVTAADEAGNHATGNRSITRVLEPEAPALAISYPAEGQSLTAATVMVSGTASCRSGLARVTWSNSRGGNGTAAGTSRWTAGPIALQPGLNLISVTALAPSGASAERSVSVTYSPPAPRQDTVRPKITITSPALSTPLTSAGSIAIRGMAFDDTGVTQVTWTDSLGNTGTADGTAYWNTGPIPLREGANAITIRAFDAAGNDGWKSLVVTRR